MTLQVTGKLHGQGSWFEDRDQFIFSLSDGVREISENTQLLEQ